MAQRVKARILAKRDTTANWNAAIGFIPMQGEIIIYTDYQTKVVDGETINIPGIKVGSGNAYVQDLAFVGELEREIILEHIHDEGIHITSAERSKWNSKLNIDDDNEVDENGALLLTRD